MSIIYLDTSALLKLYIQENHSDEVTTLLEQADGAGTNILTYTEMAAGIARAVRMQIISDIDGKAAWKKFQQDWPDFTRLKISSRVLEYAASLAWEFGLRGYDAMHLASAMIWQEALDVPVGLATFDCLLWGAGQKAGIEIWPEA
jgi:uncharacterized protein